MLPMRTGCRLWSARGAGALLIAAAVMSSSGCAIDKSQWSPQFRETTTAAGGASSGSGNGSGSGSGTGSGGTSDAGSGGATVTVTAGATQQAVVKPQPLGITPGSAAGQVARTAATVLVRTDPKTCWSLVVDGNTQRSCGQAAVSDVRGALAARVVRVSGTGEIVLGLVSGGRTVASGRIPSSGRSTTQPITVLGTR